MPALTIPNVPADVLARLSERAAHTNRTVEEEALTLLVEGFDLPDDIGPCDFQRPHEAAGTPVEAQSGGERLPAPLELDYIPSTEIPAPFDLDSAEPGVRVVPRDIPPPPLEFWFDEDKVRR